MFVFCMIFLSVNFQNRCSETDCAVKIAQEVLSTAVKANPTVSTITNTLGAIQDFRNGETVSDIVKDRFDIGFVEF